MDHGYEIWERDARGPESYGYHDEGGYVMVERHDRLTCVLAAAKRLPRGFYMVTLAGVEAGWIDGDGYHAVAA